MLFNILYTILYFIGGALLSERWLLANKIPINQLTQKVSKYKAHIGLFLFVNGIFGILGSISLLFNYSGNAIDLIYIVAPLLIFCNGFLIAYDYLNALLFKRHPNLEQYAHILRVKLFPFKELLGLVLICYSLFKLALPLLLKLN